MTMTKSDFEFLARVLRDHSRHMSERAHGALCERFAVELSVRCPRFVMQRFRSACVPADTVIRQAGNVRPMAPAPRTPLVMRQAGKMACVGLVLGLLGACVQGSDRVTMHTDSMGGPAHVVEHAGSRMVRHWTCGEPDVLGFVTCSR